MRPQADCQLEQHSETRYRTLFDLAPVAVYSCDAAGVIQDYNNRAAELWGRSPAKGDTDERFCGSFKMYRPDGTFMPHEQCPMGDVLAGKASGIHDGEVHILRPDGSRVVVIVNIAPLMGVRGEIVGAINCFYDITDRKNFEAEREQLLAKEQASRIEAEAANRAKDVFLATLSHEVRTPLSAMLGWATVLRKKKCTPEEVQEGITVIERNCRAQAQLMDDALEVSRIISGKLQLDIKVHDLASVIHAAIDVVKPAAEAKSIEIAVDIDANVNLMSCDDVRMQQVVWNLLANAIKFTPNNGTVRVSLDREDSQLRLTVADNGQGIDRDLLPQVFDRFRQADSSIQQSLGGLGLGLAIVKHIVELHGGTVTASSLGTGRGATFVVRLPIDVVHIPEGLRGVDSMHGDTASMAEPERATKNLKGLRILVVDDEPDYRRLIGKVLEDAGARVQLVATVGDAIGALAVERPDMLISDLGIPGEDGFDLIRRVRGGGHSPQQLPALALTAFASNIHAESALRSGFQNYLRKPVDSDKLIGVISDLVRPTI